MEHILEGREWRRSLGFTNQVVCKEFLSGKSIKPGVDEAYLGQLHEVAGVIIRKINSSVHATLRKQGSELDAFLEEHRDLVLAKLKDQNLVIRLNNQGRRCEEVYFSWMRGHLVNKYFESAIRSLFAPLGDRLESIGEDDFTSAETFRRAPTADLAISNATRRVAHLEVQAGFKGINDMKEHKHLEAMRRFEERGIQTYLLHFDLFNGCAALLHLNEMTFDADEWEYRAQMEGQRVWPIGSSWFGWFLRHTPPSDFQELLDLV